jgi:hypothetical protein
MAAKTLLNNVDHQDLRVKPSFGSEYGDSVNQVLIFPNEFEEVQREFPIFLRKGEAGEYQSVALLGLDRDENLFLDGGGWTSRYIPAIQARGPFSIALTPQSGEGEPEPMIHIDLDDPRVGGEGVPIFMPQGGNSPYLERVVEVLQRIYAGLELSRPCFDAFEAHGLIEPVNVEIQLGESRQYDLTDYSTISEERLAALDGSALEQLNRSGFLRSAFLILASLGNVNRLIELKNRKLEAV